MSLITKAIVGLAIYAALVAALNALPTYEEAPLPPEIAQAFQTIYSYLLAWQDILPIVTLLYCVSIIALAQVLIFFWKAAIWALNAVRGSSE